MAQIVDQTSRSPKMGPHDSPFPKTIRGDTFKIHEAPLASRKVSAGGSLELAAQERKSSVAGDGATQRLSQSLNPTFRSPNQMYSEQVEGSPRSSLAFGNNRKNLGTPVRGRTMRPSIIKLHEMGLVSERKRAFLTAPPKAVELEITGWKFRKKKGSEVTGEESPMSTGSWRGNRAKAGAFESTCQKDDTSGWQSETLVVDMTGQDNGEQEKGFRRKSRDTQVPGGGRQRSSLSRVSTDQRHGWESSLLDLQSYLIKAQIDLMESQPFIGSPESRASRSLKKTAVKIAEYESGFQKILARSCLRS